MNCEHKKTITYELKPADTIDFKQRLLEVEEGGKLGSYGRSFLTPNINRAKARSMCATTKSSAPTTDTKLFESELKDELPSSFEKRRSSARHREMKDIALPTKISNCEECGAICFDVSALDSPLVFHLVSVYVGG